MASRPDELYLIDGNSLVYRAFFALPESIATSTGFPTNAIFGFASMLVKILTEHGTKPTVVVWDAGLVRPQGGLRGVQGRPRASARRCSGEQWPHFEPLVEAFGYRNVHVDGFEADDVIASIAERARERGSADPDRDRHRRPRRVPAHRPRGRRQGHGDEPRDHRDEDVRPRGGRRALRHPARADPRLLRAEGRHERQHPRRPRDRRQDRVAAPAAVGRPRGRARRTSTTSRAPSASRTSPSTPTSRACRRSSRRSGATSRSTSTSAAEASQEPDRSRLREVFREFELRDPLRRLEEVLGEDEAAPRQRADHDGRRRGARGHARSTSARCPTRGAGARRRAARGPGGRAVRRRRARGASRAAVRRGRPHRRGGRPGGRRRAPSATGRSSPTTPSRSARCRRTSSTTRCSGAYLLEPARRGYPFRELVRGARSGRGRRGPASRATPCSPPRSRSGSASSSSTASLAGASWTTSSCRSCRSCATMERAGVRLDVERLARDHRARARGDPHAGGGGVGARGDGVRPRLAAAARRDPVREARAVAQAARQDRLLHRRARPAGDPRRARDHPQDRALARAQPARQDVLQRPAAARRRARAASTRRSCRRSPSPADWRARTRTCRTSRSARSSARRSAAASRPRPGNVLLSADYSQIELRVLAHIADEPVLKEIFVQGRGRAHRDRVAGLPARRPTSSRVGQRSQAKMINYGIVYGLSDFGLADRLGIPREEAKAIIDAYLDRFPRVRAYIEAMIAKGTEDGYVTTLWGRRRQIPELKARNWGVRTLGERLAVNSPIQGTAADVLKLAMVRAHEVARASSPVRQILTVHDELLFEGPPDARSRPSATTSSPRWSGCGTTSPRSSSTSGSGGPGSTPNDVASRSAITLLAGRSAASAGLRGGRRRDGRQRRTALDRGGPRRRARRAAVGGQRLPAHARARSSSSAGRWATCSASGASSWSASRGSAPCRCSARSRRRSRCSSSAGRCRARSARC